MDRAAGIKVGKFLLLSCCLLPAACYLLWLAPQALAAPSTQILSVSPPLLDLPELYAPGSIVNAPRSIKVTLLSEKSAKIKVRTQNFIAGGEQGEPKLVQPSDPDFDPRLALASIIYLPVTEFTLKPRESREITFDLRFPQSAEPGGHYGVVQFLVEDPSGGQIMVRNSVGTLLLVKVAGPLQETARVLSFRAYVRDSSSKRKQVRIVDPIGRPRLFFEARLRNTGNVHFKPTGMVHLAPLWGDTDKLSFPLTNILPRSIRAYTVDWEHLPIFAAVKATPTFQFGDNPQRTVSGDPIYLVIFPWRAALLLLLVFLIGRYSRGRRFFLRKNK